MSLEISMEQRFKTLRHITNTSFYSKFLKYLGILSFEFVLILNFSSIGNSTTLELDNNWNITLNSEFLTHKFNTLWKNIKIPQPETVEISYANEFTDPTSNNSKLMYLIVPSSWMPYRVFLNNVLIADNGYTDQSITRIFSSRIIPIPQIHFKEKNQILINSIGEPLLGGFRSDHIYLTDETSILLQEQIKIFLLNDIHTLFFIICLGLSLFCFLVHFKMRTVSYKYLYSGIASAAILPYDLMTTNFYSFFSLSPSSPFRIQLFFQVISWSFWGIFFLSTHRGQTKNNYFKLLSFSGVFFIYMLFAGYAGFTFSYGSYTAILAPFYLIPLFLGTYWLITLAQQEKQLFPLAIVGVISAHISLLSEIFNLNVYLVGLSTTIFGVIGSLLFLSEYFRTSEKNRSSSQFLSQLLPIPIKEEVSQMIDIGSSKTEIIQKLRGDGILTNIFVDICSFGKLTRELSSKTVYETRLLVFNYISDILQKNDIHFIKPVGDSMHFCGGILLPSRSSQTRLSTCCIYGVRDILDCIDALNIALKDKNLPEVKLKISATIGHCEFGFEGTTNSLRFDVQGHWVNITKRFEDYMDRKFYDTYGQNVALISENLFKFSEDLNIRKRFFATVKVTDKDGRNYEALVGQQYQETVTDEDVMNAIFGQFSHHSRSRGHSNAA